MAVLTQWEKITHHVPKIPLSVWEFGIQISYLWIIYIIIYIDISICNSSILLVHMLKGDPGVVVAQASGIWPY